MSSTAPAPKKEDFARTSDNESVCLLCFSTVRADRYATLELAERIHAENCLMGDNSPLLLQRAA